MEVGNALGRIHHGQLRTILLASVQVADDFVTLGLRQDLDLLVKIDHAVIDVDTQFVEQGAVLLEGFLVENLDAVTENDRVRDFHHRRFDVQREEDARLTAVFQFLLVKVAQGLLAHEHRIDDLAGLEFNFGFQDGNLAALGNQLHTHTTRLVERHRLFAVIEVTGVHVRYVGLRPLLPFAH